MNKLRIAQAIMVLHRGHETVPGFMARVTELGVGLVATASGLVLPFIAQTWAPGEIIAAITLVAAGIGCMVRFVWKLSLQRANMLHRLKQQDIMLTKINRKLGRPVCSECGEPIDKEADDQISDVIPETDSKEM